jgi:flagellar hook-associated protein 3 FlgL
VDGAENALENAVTLVDQAQTLATQGQSGFDSADTRQTNAYQLGSVLSQLVSIANTNIGGRYVFSGDSDQTAPYSIDLTQPNPVSSYQGSAATRTVASADGTTFAVSKPAEDILVCADLSQNVFQSITNLRSALLNGDQDGINSAVAGLQSADTYLNQQLAFYGTVQDRVNSSISFGSKYETQLKTQLSGIEDADLTATLTEFTQAQTQEQAALTAQGKMPHQSLFDYLA